MEYILFESNNFKYINIDQNKDIAKDIIDLTCELESDMEKLYSDKIEDIKDIPKMLITLDKLEAIGNHYDKLFEIVKDKILKNDISFEEMKKFPHDLLCNLCAQIATIDESIANKIQSVTQIKSYNRKYYPDIYKSIYNNIQYGRFTIDADYVGWRYKYLNNNDIIVMSYNDFKKEHLLFHICNWNNFLDSPLFTGFYEYPFLFPSNTNINFIFEIIKHEDKKLENLDIPNEMTLKSDEFILIDLNDLSIKNIQHVDEYFEYKKF